MQNVVAQVTWHPVSVQSYVRPFLWTGCRRKTNFRRQLYLHPALSFRPLPLLFLSSAPHLFDVPQACGRSGDILTAFTSPPKLTLESSLLLGWWFGLPSDGKVCELQITGQYEHNTKLWPYGTNSDKYRDYSLLGCYCVYFHIWIPMLWRNCTILKNETTGWSEMVVHV
jgi:hypothetical protein